MHGREEHGFVSSARMTRPALRLVDVRWAWGEAVDGAINESRDIADIGWGVVARIDFEDMRAAGHCEAPPSATDTW